MHEDSSGKESWWNPVPSIAQTDPLWNEMHENMQPYVSLRMGVLHYTMSNNTDFNRTIHKIGDKHFDKSDANGPNSLQDRAWGILLSFSN